MSRNDWQIESGAKVQESRLDGSGWIGRMCTINRSNLGSHTGVAQNSVINDASIGKFCSISWGCTIGAYSHPYNTLSTCALAYRKVYGFVDRDIPFERKRTKIGNDVCIGCGSIIIGGVRIGDGAIIGAGSVVTKDVKAYEVVAGVPAKRIRSRFDRESMKKLKDVKWWNWPDDVIRENVHLFMAELKIEDIDQIIRINKIKNNQ